MENALSPAVQKQALKSLQDEADGAAIYHFMAKRQQKKHPENAKILEQMSKDESQHYQMWAKLTGKTRRAHVFWKRIITVLLGFTFVVKSMQKGERLGQASYEKLQAEVPAAAQMLADERRHEKTLYALLDEERLHYVGAMVLGLNDALVELTGAIAGVTFALANTRLVALTGIVTGFAATLSMAASNYLAERANGNEHALKSSAYTGAAYIVTVALLVLPYLLFQAKMYVAAFAAMIATVLCIILFFNYYISVAKGEPFFRRFGEMAAISMGVAAVSFGIGVLAKAILGVDVG